VTMPEATDVDELRHKAFAVAYRMLGSVTEAEDIVQEALLRVHHVQQQGDVRSAQAYVSTVVTRLCIDHLRSARVRRETYVGEWLPEPLVADGIADPAGHAEVSDSLSLAFLVLLESLSPEQRAAFLLRDVFDYPYRDIAGIIGKSEDNTRQLVARARQHLSGRRPRFEASRERRDELAQSFLAAVETGDLGTLEALLAHDVELHGDGGGNVRAITRPVRGRARVARMLVSWVRIAEPLGGMSMRQVEVNGQPGAVLSDAAGKLIGVAVLDIADGQIRSVHSIVNPDKLRHLLPTD
jgi:RNA polymerase sigma-70 factor (TIGR02957 family)